MEPEVTWFERGNRWPVWKINRGLKVGENRWPVWKIDRGLKVGKNRWPVWKKDRGLKVGKNHWPVEKTRAQKSKVQVVEEGLVLWKQHE